MPHPIAPRVAIFALGVYAALASAGSGRRFTVEESIGLSTFAYPASQWLPGQQVVFSPDKSRFLAATVRGDLASGKQESTLWLFRSDDVRAYLGSAWNGGFGKATVLTKLSSASNRDPISRWRWSGDSKSVLFLGADDDGARHLYRVPVDGGETRTLSLPGQDVSRYDERDGAVVYLARAPVLAGDLYQAAGPTLPDIEIATGKSIAALLFPRWMDAQFETGEEELWTIVDGKAKFVPEAGNPVPLKLRAVQQLVLSPDGRTLLTTEFARRIPKSWERYRPLVDASGFRIVADTPETEGGTERGRLHQYVLIDVRDGAKTLLVDAPIELTARHSDVPARWSADGTAIAVRGVYPPLARDAPDAAVASVLPCELAVVGVRSKVFSCVLRAAAIDIQRQPYHSRQQLVSLDWAAGAGRLITEYATPDRPRHRNAKVFTKQGNGWRAGKAGGRAAGAFVVEVHEALDEPPILVVVGNDSTARPLLDPNPQLKDVALGSASFYEWRDADGDTWTGALVKPPDFSSGRRYPLVIQTHGLDRTKFLVDGPSATGFAARALAARDLVVLQVQELNKNFDTPSESATGAAGYRAAIAQLAADGIVDPENVGIIAWSHMGPYVAQGLVDDPLAYKAATFAEATFNSYAEYLLNIDYMGTMREQMFRAQVGAKPFGEGLRLWLERSAGFRTDRICASVLFQMNSPEALNYSWDTYAALRAQNKPVELLYIRNGDHVLVKPKQRLAEQGMNVDWYDYWLNGRKDPSATKAEQYRRWDAMKALPSCAAGAAGDAAGSKRENP